MPPSPKRGRDPEATRARIAESALELFERRGFAETTIDQIAVAAGVARRTVFAHFASKAAIVFDHLLVRREAAIARLRERPLSEPPIVSLHTVMRGLCDEGYDRRLLTQIRAVLAAEPELEALGTEGFEHDLIAAIQRRDAGRAGARELDEIHALTNMVVGWFLTAVRIYLRDGRRSLVRCFDDVVATCTRAVATDLH